jgi:Glycerate kinase family
VLASLGGRLVHVPAYDPLGRDHFASCALLGDDGSPANCLAPYALDVLGFDARLRSAGAVVVREGRLDPQSLTGKIVGEITSRAHTGGVPVHAIVRLAQIDDPTAAGFRLRSVTEASTLVELESAGERLGRLVAAR